LKKAKGRKKRIKNVAIQKSRPDPIRIDKEES